MKLWLASYQFLICSQDSENFILIEIRSPHAIRKEAAQRHRTFMLDAEKSSYWFSDGI